MRLIGMMMKFINGLKRFTLSVSGQSLFTTILSNSSKNIIFWSWMIETPLNWCTWFVPAVEITSHQFTTSITKGKIQNKERSFLILGILLSHFTGLSLESGILTVMNLQGNKMKKLLCSKIFSQKEFFLQTFKKKIVSWLELRTCRSSSLRTHQKKLKY